MKMIGQAAANGWLVSNDLKQKALEAIERVFDDHTSTNRERTSATLALVAVETLNLKHDKKRRAESDGNRFLEAAERLGIGYIAPELPEADPRTGDDVIDVTPVDRSGEGRFEEKEQTQ